MKSLGKLILLGILAGFLLSVIRGSNINPRPVSASNIGWPVCVDVSLCQTEVPAGLSLGTEDVLEPAAFGGQLTT